MKRIWAHIRRTVILAVRLTLLVLLERYLIWLFNAEGNWVVVLNTVTVIAAVIQTSVHFVREVASAFQEYDDDDDE